MTTQKWWNGQDIIITQNNESMRKRKLDEKRRLHLLGAGQLSYLRKSKKISRHDAKLIQLTTPDNKDCKWLNKTLSKRINFIPD